MQAFGRGSIPSLVASFGVRPQSSNTQRLYRAAGYAEIAPYNDNPFACFWGEKRLTL